MKCDCYEELWSKYCENELDRESKEKLEEHLSSCRVCAEGIAAFRKTMEALKGLPRLEASASFDARLARALAEERLADREPWLRKMGRVGVKLAPAAASIAAVFVISLVLALHFAPGGGEAPEVGPGRDLSAAGPASPAQVPVSSAGRAQVRVEPWSVAGQWPQSLADSTTSNYRMRFVLDKVILEGEEAARASVPEGGQDVRAQYVTF